ncbi:MAG: hypothetical protein IJN20_05520, partial [Oscillospiraceae bacterium]|nr:hypothetical protein [Oscillospiraceae bacterium]
LSSFYQKIFDIFLAKALKVFRVRSFFHCGRVTRLETSLSVGQLMQWHRRRARRCPTAHWAVGFIFFEPSHFSFAGR